MPIRFKWIVLISVITATVLLLHYLCIFVKDNLGRQYRLFRNKHTWVMSV